MSDQQPGTSKPRPGGSRKRKANDTKEMRWMGEDLLQTVLDSDLEDEDYLLPSEDLSSVDESESEFSEGEEISHEGMEIIIPAPVMPQNVPVESPTSGNQPMPVVRQNLPPVSFTEPKGLCVNPPETNTPYGWFQLLFTVDLLTLLVEETNINALKILCHSTTSQAHVSHWKDTTIDEMELFLALIFLMGIIPLPNISLYWKRLEHVFDFPCFYKVMSRDRFLLILRCLHFGRNLNEDDPTPHDPLHKIRPFLNATIDGLRHIYYPEKNLSLHKSVLLWRGRLSFRKYNLMKNHKYGTKLFMLMEPSGYVLDLLVYCGAKDSEEDGVGHTKKVVRKMMERYLGASHSLYKNNCCDSVRLATELFNKDTYATGSLKNSQQGNRPSVDNKHLARKESIQQFTDNDICVIKWRDRRDVLTISSEFSSRPMTVTLRRGKTAQKPEIAQYNKHIRGLDRADQLLSYYPMEHKSLRWYLKVGVHIFHILMNNISILYNTYSNNRKLSTLQFRQTVIQKIISKHAPPTPKKCLPLPGLVHLPAFGKKQIRCQECSKTGKRKMVKSFCPNCPLRPKTATGTAYAIGLCIENCFRKYHNY